MSLHFSYELDDEEFQTVYTANREAMKESGGGLLVDIFPPARYLPPTRGYRNFLENFKIYSSFLMKHVELHRKVFNPGEFNNGGRDIKRTGTCFTAYVYHPLDSPH